MKNTESVETETERMALLVLAVESVMVKAVVHGEIKLLGSLPHFVLAL
jgi:hypothetical protein